ncbi:MAG: C_GCAxxG_C_C family protein [Chloroflexi bacterium]|jgi:C_GCAxxG_C_C family probable redox protein|nr:C_GCAxxG_C_C family protein [Chloroflexota bacterium]
MTTGYDFPDQRAEVLMSRGYHCSEALFIAVSEILLGELDPFVYKMLTGFAGGVGCSHTELCGAISGAVLAIGARYGRTEVEVDDARCQALVAQFREQFETRFGATQCAALQRLGYGANGTTPCRVLVGQATNLLLELLAAEEPARSDD